jgi:phosphoribosylformylglycinamidine synthase
MGIPTVGGEVNFHPAYNGNILVNAMTVGVARTDKIFYARAAGIGNPVVYVGAKTGRDGIHGATMASAEFNADSEEKRPTVQVGDPFTEKLLLEACLELMATDAIVAIQDMGAAGLTSSSVEMAGKGGMGIELELDKVPMRETGMMPYELMLSESQERMLMVLKPEAREKARAIFEKWELDFAEIGRLTDTGRLVLKMAGVTAADIPLAPLVNEAPLYDRPRAAPPAPRPFAPTALPALSDPAAALLQLLGSPDLCSRRWIWEQYDHMVGADTLQRPGGDAAVVRVHGTQKALAMTTDCTPRYCLADPKLGGAQAVAEAWRNLTAVGAKPLAVTNNLNFGNPERPEIMGQLAGCIEGMAEACRALDFPVVSGNVSLYNETEGRAILPTPVIGGVGLVEAGGPTVTVSFKQAGHLLILVGESRGHLGQSLYLRELHGREDGPPPPLDLQAERRNGEFVRAQIAAGRVAACHDVSDGGLLVALAEMAMAGGLGAELEGLEAPPAALAGLLFGEDQGRYVLEVAERHADALAQDGARRGAPLRRLGRVGGPALTLPGGHLISVAEMRRVHEAGLPALMGAA